jgi:uncharacterized protein
MHPDQNLVSDKSPLRSLAVTFAMITIGFVIVGPILGDVFASMFYDGDLAADIQKGQLKPNSFYPLLIMQAVATFVGLILFPILQIKYLEQKRMSPFFPPQPKLLFIILIIGLLTFNFIVAISPIIQWNETVNFPEFMNGLEETARNLEEKMAALTKSMTQFDSTGELLAGLFVIALLPAIGEELVFRGVIQNEIWRGAKNAHVAIWFSAFLFSTIHFQFFGFVPRLLLGAMFGYLYYWSGNLVIPIAAHFFNNAISVVALYLHQNKVIETNVEETQSAPVGAVIFSMALASLLLFFLWRFFREHRLQKATL